MGARLVELVTRFGGRLEGDLSIQIIPRGLSPLRAANALRVSLATSLLHAL